MRNGHFHNHPKSNIYKQQGNNWGNQCDFAVTVIPKVYEENNKYSKSKLLTNSQTITLPTYHFSNQNMSKKDFRASTEPTIKLITLPKNPCQVGRESA